MSPATRRRASGPATGLLLVGLLLGCSPATSPSAEPVTRAGRQAAATSGAPGVADASGDVTAVAVGVPSIGVRSDLVELGLQDDGTVEVPSDPDEAGWFALGPPPGGPGSTVLLGHVDSVAGPAVFARLAEVRRGAVVVVSLSDGRRLHYRVRAVRTYANDDFPAQRVYGGRGRGQLALVTCGGTYDAARGGWQSNVVAWARPA